MSVICAHPNGLVASIVFLACLGGSACAPIMPSGRFVRDTDEPGIDSHAMSTGLDRRDLERIFIGQVDDFLASPFYLTTSRRPRAHRGTIAMVPMRNHTSEHVHFQLYALMSKFETALVKSQGIRVVSLENHPEIMAQIEVEQSPAFDPHTAARYGKLLGVNYIATGKVTDNTERITDARRVQYFLFLQVIDVETAEVVWQNESAVTKALLID